MSRLCRCVRLSVRDRASCELTAAVQYTPVTLAMQHNIDQLPLLLENGANPNVGAESIYPIVGAGI